MKTVGEILKNARLAKKISLEEAENSTKIRKKFLLALEENDWSKIPSMTYTKGFTKNYVEFLGLNLGVVMAIFRRQSDELEKPGVLPAGLAEPLNESFWRLTPSKIIGGFVIILIFLFFFWLFNQYQSFVWSPKITLASPPENAVIKQGSVEISGQTDPWVTLTINGQEIKLNNGKFDEHLEVNTGTVVIEIKATNKFGRTSKINRTIRVESP